MENSICPFCREKIKAGAIKCKHCGSLIVDVSASQQVSTTKGDGTLWLPVSSLVLGIICFLTLFDDTPWDKDTFIGVFSFTIIGLTLGVLSINTQNTGRGMAISGIILSIIAMLGAIGTIN